MTELDDKVALLVDYIAIAHRMAMTIADDHLARVVGRAVMIGVDAFLKLAPALKNELVARKTLTKADGDALKASIKKLEADYESYYATIRDRMGAHQQEVRLPLLLAAWNEIDEVTLTLFADDVQQIWQELVKGGAARSSLPPAELDDPHAFDSLANLENPYGSTPLRFVLDRYGPTREGAASLIAVDPSQEKAMRVIGAFDAIKMVIDSALEQRTSALKRFLPEKVAVDLIIVDACSVIDNLFEDDPSGHTDPSLVSVWRNAGHAGVSLIAGFQRNARLERELRTVRNKVSAHLDGAMPLKDLEDLLRKLNLQEVHQYLSLLWDTFIAACRADGRTIPFSLHGRPLAGFTSIDSPAAKPFRQPPATSTPNTGTTT